MEKPSLPSNEAERLQSLLNLGLLDTAEEERFDRLTRLARRLFDVPIALVSLLDEQRQWFKSCVGLEQRETPRDISFCGHAILGSRAFMIPDTSVDPRFADNPLVTGEPHIRFYAGCPIMAPDGHRVGTLCLIDRVPRRLADEDLLLLRDLAAMVEDEIAAKKLASVDELTNIPNRRGFLQMASHALALCQRQEQPASLVFLDLDGFKKINDNHGHAEGDRALRLFADTLREVFRESDCFARLGGDEFTILLARTTNADAEQVVARFRQALSQRCSEQPWQIACSHGIVAYDPACHAGIEDLLGQGDALMYRHKQQNRH